MNDFILILEAGFDKGMGTEQPNMKCLERGAGDGGCLQAEGRLFLKGTFVLSLDQQHQHLPR